MRFQTICALSITVLLLCVSPSLGKKPTNPPNPGEKDRTRYEAYLEAGDYSGTGVLLTGDLGTSNMPNDCETSFRALFGGSRAPLVLVPAEIYLPDPLEEEAPIFLPGVDLELGTADDVAIWAHPTIPWGYPTPSGFNVVLNQSEPGWIDSVGVEIRNFPDSDFYSAKVEGLFDVEHPCPIDESGLPKEAFAIDINQTLEVRSQKGKKYVGDIYLGRLVFCRDEDNDPSTANLFRCSP